MNKHDVLTHLGIPQEFHDRIIEWADSTPPRTPDSDPAGFAECPICEEPVDLTRRHATVYFNIESIGKPDPWKPLRQRNVYDSDALHHVHLDCTADFKVVLRRKGSDHHGAVCREPIEVEELLARGCDAAWTCDHCGQDWVTEVTGERHYREDFGTILVEPLPPEETARVASHRAALHAQRLRRAGWPIPNFHPFPHI